MASPQGRERSPGYSATNPRIKCAIQCLSSFNGSRDDPGEENEAQREFDDVESFDEEHDDMNYLYNDDDGDDHPYRSNPWRQNENSEEGEGSKRLYLDPKAPLEERITRFVNVKLGTMHPMDILLTSVDLIRAGGKQRTFEGMKFAHDVLDRIIEEKHYFNAQTSLDGATPPPYTIVIPEGVFEVLMYGWSNLCRKVPFAPQRMREILDLMIQEAEYDEALKEERRIRGFPIPENVRVHGQKPSDVDPAILFASMSCQPTIAIYNTLLNGLAQGSYRSIASADEAEDVLRKMERVNRRRRWHVKPNTKSFMTVITAFARTQHVSAGERAESVLRRMIRYHEDQLALYAEESGTEYDLENPDNNTRKIVTPDTIAYTAVIQAYADSSDKNSAERGVMLLTELLQSTNPNLKVDAYVFSVTINAFAKRAAKSKTPPDRLDAAEAAESVLWLMLDTLENREIQGNLAVPFNTCMTTWANANLRESPKRAEAVLQKMLDASISNVRPGTDSFNACMQVWSRAARQDPEAPRNAQDLLQLMEQIENVEPDITSYTTLMGAYARSSRPDKVFQARKVLELLLSNFETKPSAKDQLSAVPFTVVLNAVASCKDGNHQTEPAQDDPFGVDAESTITGEDPYSVALKTYDECTQDLYELGIYPDHLLFSSMLDVIEAHTNVDSIERRQRIERVFEEACSAGEVSSMVVQALVKACPSRDMLLSLLTVNSWPIESVNALPREWIRRVQPKFKKIKVENRPGKKHGGGRRAHGKERQRQHRSQN